MDKILVAAYFGSHYDAIADTTKQACCGVEDRYTDKFCEGAYLMESLCQIEAWVYLSQKVV